MSPLSIFMLVMWFQELVFNTLLPCYLSSISFASESVPPSWLVLVYVLLIFYIYVYVLRANNIYYSVFCSNENDKTGEWLNSIDEEVPHSW